MAPPAQIRAAMFIDQTLAGRYDTDSPSSYARHHRTAARRLMRAIADTDPNSPTAVDALWRLLTRQPPHDKPDLRPIIDLACLTTEDHIVLGLLTYRHGTGHPLLGAAATLGQWSWTRLTQSPDARTRYGLDHLQPTLGSNK